MARVKTNAEFDVSSSDDILSILENLSRDLSNIEDRQKRLKEAGVELQLKNDSGEIVVELKDA